MNNPIGVVSCHMRFEAFGEAFAKASQLGLDQIEWFEYADCALTVPGGPAEEIVRLADEHGITNTYHAPWQGDWNLGVVDEPAATAMLADMIRRAARLNARHMTMHMGGPFLDDQHSPASRGIFSKALDSVIGAIAANVPLAEALDVCICVESQPGGLCATVEDFDQLFARVASPRVGLHLDVGHTNITGTLDALLARHGRRLMGTHLHDNDGEHDEHLPPGEGTIDWPALLGALTARGYDGALTCEFPEDSGAYPAFIQRLRDFHAAP